MGQKHAQDVAEAVDQGRKEAASEIARVSENAELAERRCAAAKAEADAAAIAVARERAAFAMQAETLRMDKQLLEAEVKRLKKVAETAPGPASLDSVELASRVEAEVQAHK